MTISGFTFVKNTAKLYYPFVESIISILPIVDEFVVLAGNSDEDDTTLAEIMAIGSDKIKIYHSVWEPEKYPNNTLYAQQTDLAKSYCTGDWLFYLQSDELVHEKYLPVIKEACEHYQNDDRIEGLLFKYRHFWGDYDHYQHSHKWYKHEIRIIKNNPKIHSWRDAQSFRYMEDFDGISYDSKKGTRKLNVAKLDAYIYHYGWVRPPKIMKMKDEQGTVIRDSFDYGPMKRLSNFKETHPKILDNWIKLHDWKDELYDEAPRGSYPKHKDMKTRVKIATFFEGLLFKHEKEIGGFNNYKIKEDYFLKTKGEQ